MHSGAHNDMTWSARLRAGLERFRDDGSRVVDSFSSQSAESVHIVLIRRAIDKILNLAGKPDLTTALTSAAPWPTSPKSNTENDIGKVGRAQRSCNGP